MATRTHKSSTALAERPRDLRPQAFRAPSELPAEFGVQAVDEKIIQGVVSTENIRGLLDSFGLSDRENISIPFHHMKSQHGERWSLRIESPAVHEIDGKHVTAHQWLYRREYPELTAGE